MQNFDFTQPSILQRLYDALDERGRLPREFSLRHAMEQEGQAQGVYYSDGFMEGNSRKSLGRSWPEHMTRLSRG